VKTRVQARPSRPLLTLELPLETNRRVSVAKHLAPSNRIASPPAPLKPYVVRDGQRVCPIDGQSRRSAVDPRSCKSMGNPARPPARARSGSQPHCSGEGSGMFLERPLSWSWAIWCWLGIYWLWTGAGALLHQLRQLPAGIVLYRVALSDPAQHDRAAARRHLGWAQPRGDSWFSEFPAGRRPVSTTWPWTIKPALAVLWGVCWMFYGPAGAFPTDWDDLASSSAAWAAQAPAASDSRSSREPTLSHSQSPIDGALRASTSPFEAGAPTWAAGGGGGGGGRGGGRRVDAMGADDGSLPRHSHIPDKSLAPAAAAAAATSGYGSPVVPLPSQSRTARQSRQSRPSRQSPVQPIMGDDGTAVTLTAPHSMRQCPPSPNFLLLSSGVSVHAESGVCLAGLEA
jgi:hypothetical protein